MNRTSLLVPVILAGLLSACSVQIDQTPLNSQVTPVTIVPVDVTPSPTLPPTIDLGDLDLPGRLIVNHLTDGILVFDLATGEVANLFTPDPGGLLTAFSASPDGTQLVIAYSPPPGEGKVQFGYTSLFVMPLDGSAPPEPYLLGDDEEGYFTPSWAPDGLIYYGHFLRSELSPDSSGYQMERAAYPDQTGEGLLDDALWPDFSPDGARMTYIQFNRQTFIDELYVANVDGSDARPLLGQGLFQAVDAPRFSPDGSQVLFSAVSPPPDAPADSSLWDRLFGVKVAKAHAVPSDLWMVSAEGGQPEQLTDLFVVGISGDFSPDGAQLAYISVEGLFLMNADGSGAMQLLANPALAAIQWIP